MRRCRLLVVEDDHVCACLCQQAFSDESFEVLIATTLAEARQVLDTERIDLVLLDLGLPDGDGLSLLGPCQARDLPVIVTTYRDHPDERVTGLKVGADDYVTKPFHPDELVIRVEKILASRAAHTLGRQASALASDDEPFPLQLDDARLVLSDFNGRSLQLTRGEARIARLLLKSGGFASHDALASAVAGDASVSSDRSIAVLISRLRKKLSGSPEFMHWRIEPVYGAGYQLTQQPLEP